MKKRGSNMAEEQKTATSSPPSIGQHAQSLTSPSVYTESDELSPASGMYRSHLPQSNAPKVAIPRLRRKSEDHPSSKATAAGDKNRVAHACEPCRQRKTKCSGERPVCQHCQDFKLTCVYADGKRDRTKKQLGSLAEKVEDYERLLKDLSLRAGIQDQEQIRKALDIDQSSDEDGGQATVNPRGRSREARGNAGEDRVSARVGSTESMDRVREDYNRGPDTRATGFHGKNSDLTWMARLKTRASQSSTESDHSEENMATGETSPSYQNPHFDRGPNPISACTYHCDDLNPLLHENIDLYAIPSRANANALFQSYLETVHPSFPIIGKTTFTQQYNTYFRRADQRKPNPNWLAILNMIFAIGAKYSHMIRANWHGDDRDGLIFFTRARMLGFNADAILGHSELQKVQITGLIAFYLMAINQINRSWTVSGIAIRHASTLGLNLRNESQDVPEDSKEIRYRVWWAICSTERLLAVMTGRPTSFTEADCTAPPPLPAEEDRFIGSGNRSPRAIQMLRHWSSQESRQSDYPTTAPNTGSPDKKSRSSSFSPAINRSSSQEQEQEQLFPPCNALCFTYATKLGLFTNEVLNSLYRAAAMSEPWSHVQATIANLNKKLEDWHQSLPHVFDFTESQLDQQFLPQRMRLGFLHYSTSIIINRPCLCRMDRRIKNQSDKSKTFNRETAARCVRAARSMLNMLPNQPNALGLYKIAPWWCLVHWMMQAAIVSMLELSFRADHMPNEVEDVFSTAKKALQWLRDMSKTDEASGRAAGLCFGLLRQLASKVGKDPNEAWDLQQEDVASFQNTGQVQGGQDSLVKNTYPVHENLQEMQDTQGMNDMSMYYGSQPNLATPISQAAYTGLNQFQSPMGYFTSAAFQPEMFAAYDQVAFYDQVPATSAQTSYDDVFPAATSMEGLHFGDAENPSYYEGQSQNWHPGRRG